MFSIYILLATIVVISSVVQQVFDAAEDAATGAPSGPAVVLVLILLPGCAMVVVRVQAGFGEFEFVVLGDGVFMGDFEHFVLRDQFVVFALNICGLAFFDPREFLGLLGAFL